MHVHAVHWLIEFFKRNRRYADAKSTRVRKKRLPENGDAVTRIDSIEIFVQRADKNSSPEPIDGALSLLLLLQPIQHRYRCRPPTANDLQHAPRYGALVQPVEQSKRGK